MDDTFMASKAIRLSAKLFGTVTIRRDQPLEAIRKTIEALESGHVVALFPEGQLTRTGGLCELERGFELIARKAKSPIFPLWVDGSWGSVFSFERGRFFRKIPHRVPYGLSIAVGGEITGQPDREILRDALLKASSEAVAAKFPPNTIPARINGHQLTQLDALPRGAELHVLEGELDPALVSSLHAFTRLTRGRLITHGSFGPYPGEHWIGGNTLRKQIAGSDPLGNKITFHDFGSDALLPLEKENLIHLPCYAAGGDVIAMSMPHPEKPPSTETFQAGHKPGSWGKLLPGWHIEGGKIFPGGLPLPDGAKPDGECFLVRGE
jgi:acyl-[acyl-carrier-protein]-phospholipid O-acyltransferase/long-chain-fatty-acid--[acyl-carrier-protein] ligase